MLFLPKGGVVWNLPYSNAHIPLKNEFALGAWRKWNQHKKYEMYMPNAKTQRQGPNATYIPLAGVGVLRREKRKFYFLHFFRYEHVGIPNAK